MTVKVKPFRIIKQLLVKSCENPYRPGCSLLGSDGGICTDSKDNKVRGGIKGSSLCTVPDVVVTWVGLDLR